MASTYMDDFRQQKYSARDTAITSEQNKCSYTVAELEKQKKPKAKFMDFYLIPLIIFAALGAISCIYISFWGIVLGVILGLALNYLMFFLKSKIVDNYNAKIDGKISDVNYQAHQNCQRYTENCENEIKQEENRYKTNAGKSRKAYGGSTVIDPMVNWIATAFDNRIRSTDRGAYIQLITAELCYRINENEIVILDYLPHSGTYSESQKFNFFQNRFNDIPDFFDRVGLAQALSKRVELIILNRYPLDPIAPSRGNRPKVIIDYNDAFIKLIYQVYNPNFRVAVDAKVGLK